jgi:hypothetical protein
MITHCPKMVNVLPGSRTVRPVTQTADVAVNRASTQAICPDTVEAGSSSKRTPAAMTRRKLASRMVEGWDLRMRDCIVMIEISCWMSAAHTFSSLQWTTPG